MQTVEITTFNANNEKLKKLLENDSDLWMNMDVRHLILQACVPCQERNAHFGQDLKKTSLYCLHLKNPWSDSKEI